MHASKGLEFDIVFITGLEEDMFPHFRSKNDKKLFRKNAVWCMWQSHVQERNFIWRLLRNVCCRAERSQVIQVLSSQKFRARHSSGWAEIRSSLVTKSRTRTLGEAAQGRAKNYSSPYRNSSYGGSTKPSSHRFASNVPEWAKGIIETKKEKLQTQKIRAKQNSNSPYKAGININHEKFGPGVILDTQGAGDDMVLIVKFKTGGIKNLLARIAGKKITIL